MPFTDTALEPLAESAAGVLDAVRETRAARDREDARLLVLAVEWAVLHPAESVEEAYVADRFLHADRPVLLAGPGTPLVGEFAIAEFAGALRLPTEAGRDLIADALELCHRLPRLWRRVQAGDLPAWRARRVAQATVGLPEEGARFVDDRVAAFAHKIGPATVDRLVEEALVRFDPDTAKARAEAAAEHRHVTVRTDQVDSRGTVFLSGELDLADALDLDQALDDGARRLAALGATGTHQARRAAALGDLARLQPTLDTASKSTDPTTDPGETHGVSRRSREVVLHVHLSAAALEPDRDGQGIELARVDNTRSCVTADQVRSWCAAPNARVTVRPVIDLAERIRVDAYQAPDRLAEQVRVRDGTCVFPWCARTARSCDLDHVIPYDAGGPTSTDNLAPLCRRHHRLKTFGGWRYAVAGPGQYAWTSPHGMRFHRDQHGTTALDHPPDP
jgi:5-methylcytosine-specific restriction endonuclease McrA